MKIKLFKAVGAVLLIASLIGCTRDPYINDYVNKATQAEISLITALNFNGNNSCNILVLPIRKAIFNRKVKPSENARPFSDMETTVKAVDTGIECFSKTTTMQGLYEKIYSEPLFPDKIDKFVTQEDVTKATMIDQVVEDTVTLGGDTLISPSKVRELTLSAKECNRAKVSLLSLTEDGRYLTIEDYQEVTKLILDCENLKLQVELNN